MTQGNDFSGNWHFCHWYPTVDDSSEESGKYEMVAHQKGDDVVFESTKDNNKNAYMIVRLKLDGNGRLATGTWHENADMDGPFEGTNYSGAGQLIISKDGLSMDGMWAGAGFDHALGQPRIYTGRWELKKSGK